MNKSKFLKKSLAAILSVLMVVAMIPLSAAAAYEPEGVKPAIGTGFSGEVTGSEYNWNIDFDYNANKPTITVETGVETDKIYQIWQADVDGHKAGVQNPATPAKANATTLNTERDKDGNPLPIKFRIVKNDGTAESELYTVTWTMKAASTSASVKSAKLDGTYDGVVDETAKTITFTVPFGYPTGKNYTIEMNGCAGSSVTSAFGTANTGGAIETDGNGVIGTNKVKAVAEKLTTVTENSMADVSYNVYVVEEEGLKSIKIGDYEGKFVMKASPDQDYQTGTIEFAVPADFSTAADGTLKLVPTFEVGSHYSGATLATATTPAKIVSGEEYDFAYMLTESNASRDADLVLTSVTGCTRTYDLKFVKNNTDTTLTGVTVSNGSGATGASYDVEATIDGENITAIVPKEADLTRVKLVFAGPKEVNSAKPTVKAPVTGTASNFNDKGKTDGTNTNPVDCTKPVRILVTAADGTTQKYYTLTVTKADETEQKPTITAAKLVINKGDKDNEYTADGVIDNSARTITFTVPHSTKDTDIQSGGTTEYTFAKSQSSFINTTNLGTATIKDGSSVVVSAGGGDSLTYAVKYVLANPETGKTISNFVLTTAKNKNEIDYNNNKKYTVTATSDGKFKVTLPDEDGTDYLDGSSASEMYASFELSKGAKLYKTDKSAKIDGTNDLIAAPDKDGELTKVTFYAAGNATSFIVADEKLAALIDKNDDSIKQGYAQMKNNYGANMVEYTFDITEEAKTGNRLKTISGLDGNVTGSIGNGDDGTTKGDAITLTVPFSYAQPVVDLTSGSVDAKYFFLDFTTDEGAALSITDNSKPANGPFDIYSGGKVKYDPASKKIKSLDYGWTANPAFAVAGDTTNGYKLYVGKYGSGGGVQPLTTNASDATVGAYTLNVKSESGTTKAYYIKEIKVAEANTGAEITEAKVNGSAATIDQTAEAITANVPFGTNLGQIKLELTASKMADVKVNGVTYNADNTVDCRKDVKIEVTSEKGDKKTVYTLKVKTGEQFSDVPADVWFADYVKKANDLGIVMGYADGTFKPFNSITRQDFALMTVRMLGVKTDDDATVVFKDADDVRADARGAVAYLAENDIIGGYTDGTFKPNGNITRSEAAKILAAALELEVEGEPDFADNSKIANWAKPYVAACQKAGIFTGDQNKNFNGGKNITRAEAAKVMVESNNIK